MKTLLTSEVLYHVRNEPSEGLVLDKLLVELGIVLQQWTNHSHQRGIQLNLRFDKADNQAFGYVLSVRDLAYLPVNRQDRDRAVVVR
jgi:hypothetical protein